MDIYEMRTWPVIGIAIRAYYRSKWIREEICTSDPNEANWIAYHNKGAVRYVVDNLFVREDERAYPVRRDPHPRLIPKE